MLIHRFYKYIFEIFEIFVYLANFYIICEDKFKVMKNNNNTKNNNTN